MSVLQTLRADAGDLLDRLRWEWASPYSLPQQAEQIAIVGLPGAGKKTLCNSLWGWEVLGADLSAETVQDFGLFTLADLPLDAYEADHLLFRLETADLVVYVLDVVAGLQTEDFRWIARLRATGKSLVVACNKIDQLPTESVAERVGEIERRLSMPIVPLSGQDGQMVHGVLLPAMLKASPHLDVPLATEIAGLRRSVAARLIWRHAITSALVSLEPVPLVDVSVLIGMQMQLVNRIAAVYGHKGRAVQRRDIMMTVGLGLGLRFTTQTLAKAVPVAGWLVSSAVGASATWAVGRAALAFYGADLPPLRRWVKERWTRLRHGIPRPKRA